VVTAATELQGKLDFEKPLETESGLEDEDPEDGDYLAQTIQRLAHSLKTDPIVRALETQQGKPYGALMEWVANHLPQSWDNPKDWARYNLPRILDEAFGNGAWETYRAPGKDNTKEISWVRLKQA
jgi:hypothetical protein